MNQFAAQLRIYTLGGLRVVWGDIEVPAREWQRKRAAELLRFLVESPNFRIHGQRIEARLWPDSERRAARTNLRVKLFDLRAILAAHAPAGVDVQSQPPVLYEAGMLSLNPLYRPWVDAQAFETAAFEAIDQLSSQHADAIKTADRALALWTGEYFDGEGDEIGLMASRYSGLRRELVMKLAEFLGASPRAERELETCFNDYPWDEQLADTLVQYLVGSGRRSRAHEVFQRHEAALLTHSGAAASKHLAKLIGKAGRPGSSPKMGISRLIGRELEMQVAEAALGSIRDARGTRLEIFGSRGSGKTRLLDEIGDVAQRMGLIPILAKAYRGCTADAIAQQLLHGMWRFRTDADEDEIESTDSWASLQKIARRIMKNAPLVVLIDDADLLEGETARKLGEMLISADGAYMIVRTQHWSRRGSGRDAYSIHLRPLNAEESLHVVSDAFSGLATSELEKQVRDLWPGELSVLVGSAQHVQSTGSAVLEDGKWTLRPEVNTSELLSLETRASLMRRIGELRKEDSAVLEGITVAGVHPAIPLLSELLGLDAEQVRTSIQRLELADLVWKDGDSTLLPTAVRVVVTENMERVRRRTLSERAARLRGSSPGGGRVLRGST